MNRLTTVLTASLILSACAPAASPPPTYATTGPARPARAGAGLSVRGRIPRGQRVEYIVAIAVDQRTGRRQRVRVRPAADGSYVVALPRGHRYALAYEAGGRVTGNVAFPNPRGGAPTQTINVTQNVVVNQNNQSQYVDLGDTNYVNGQFVAAYDPYAYMDSDGDGIPDEQDPDDAADFSATVAVDGQAFMDGDFDDLDEGDGGEMPGAPVEEY